ncbi:unnamed protein product [Calypogeia fissa]
MAGGELELREKGVVPTIGGCSGVGNLGHGPLKNGFKAMAPAEVLLQSLAVDSNGNLKRNVEQQQGKAAAGDVVVDKGGTVKDTELTKEVVDIQQQKGFSKQQVHDLKALLQALTLISRNLPLPGTLLGEVQSISHSKNVYGRQNGVNGETQTAQTSQVDSHESHEVPPQISKSTTRSPLSVRAKDFTTSTFEHGVNKGKGETSNVRGDGENNALRSAQIEVSDGVLKVEVFEGDAGKLLTEFEDAVAAQRPRLMSAATLREEKDRRVQSQLANRIHELEDLHTDESEDVRLKKLLELHTLKLLGLQMKVRTEVVAELHLQEICARPDKTLFDWGLVRIRRPTLSGFDASIIAGVPSTDSDERLRRKRKAERQRRMEEEEKARITTRKRKFFNELLNLVREFQLYGQAGARRRKQRNDGVQAWHTKQRQRVSRAERLRFQALKADDQEAYMRMVEESKNERLTTLLSKTDELLQRLGAMVQIQKDADPEDNLKKEKQKDKVKETGVESLTGDREEANGRVSEEIATSRAIDGERRIHGSNEALSPEDDDEMSDAELDASGKKRDLMEGQRQYNSAVHSIEEQVTEQPAMLEGGQLRQYQIEGLQWMLSLYNNNLNGILADEMGLGKTIQTIALLAYLLEKKGLQGPHIIIAPKAVLPNWAHEFKTWAPSMVAVLYDGRIEDRKVMREEYCDETKFNVLVTHYDLIMRDKAFLKKIRWHYMIVDEGHRLKNHDCMLSRTLVNGYHIRRRLLLTGTPIQNSLSELWSLLNFLLPAIFNSSSNFEEWFNAPFADRSEVSLSDEEQLLVIRRLHQVIRPFLLRRKKAEVEKFLPGKTQVILKCDLSAWQRLYYQQVINSGRVGLDSGSGKSRGLQNTAMQLRKCCNHPFLFLEGGDYTSRLGKLIVRSSGKFELLDRLLPKLRKTGHRVLLFSQMTRLMDVLEDYLELQGYKYLRLDGTTKTEERGTLLKKFNAPDSPYFMFLLSTRAGGLGLNLQTADTVIIFDSDWNPQMDQQAEDRAHRIGQKKEVRVFVLVSVGSIEEEILERAKSKMGIDAKVIQAGLFNTTSTAQERREMLEQIMRRGADALGADVPSEREINRLAARSEEEFEVFEEMDEIRRTDEGYRGRLMEEHEVPDWVFLGSERSKPAQAEQNSKAGDANILSEKRKRKEVLYTDVLSDSQWMKAIEDGEDMLEAVKTQLFKRMKKTEVEVNGVDEEGAGREEEEELDMDGNKDDTPVRKGRVIDIDSDDDAIGGKTPVKARSKGEGSTKGEERLARRFSAVHQESVRVTAREGGAIKIVHGSSDTWKGMKRKRSKAQGR